jgi:hypothetical protein
MRRQNHSRYLQRHNSQNVVHQCMPDAVRRYQQFIDRVDRLQELRRRDLYFFFFLALDPHP